MNEPSAEYRRIPLEYFNGRCKPELQDPYHDGQVLRGMFDRAGLMSDENRATQPIVKDESTLKLIEHFAALYIEIAKQKNTQKHEFVCITLSMFYKIVCPLNHDKLKSPRKLFNWIDGVVYGRDYLDDVKLQREIEEDRPSFMKLKNFIETRRGQQAESNRSKREERKAEGLTDEQRAAFDEIYNRHPEIKRGQRGRALTAFIKALSEVTAEELNKRHAAFCDCPQWQEPDYRYTPKLNNWLFERQWNMPTPQERDNAQTVERRRPWDTAPSCEATVGMLQSDPSDDC